MSKHVKDCSCYQCTPSPVCPMHDKGLPSICMCPGKVPQSPCGCLIASLDLAVDYEGPMKAGPYISYCPIHALAAPMLELLKEIEPWFKFKCEMAGKIEALLAALEGSK